MENEEIYSFLRQGEILEVEKNLKLVEDIDEKILVLEQLLKIFKNEVSGNIERTVFDYSTDIDELAAHYTKTKLMLRRMDFDMPKEYVDEFYGYCEEKGVSFCMLMEMLMINIFNKGKVCLALKNLYSEKKGEQSFEAQSFSDLYKYIGE